MKFFLFIVLICFGTNKLKAQQLSFQYDNAGNQIVREWICVNCPRISSVDTYDQQLLNTDHLKDHKLSAYPNPLTEVLYVKWWNEDDVSLTSIEVYSLNGTRLFYEKFSSQQNQTSISFLNLAAGTYILRALYSNKKLETLKLIKQ